MYHIVDHKFVQSEFNERLQKTAQANRARRLSASQPHRSGGLLPALGKVLVAVGQKLKAQGQPAIVPQA